MIYDKFKNRVKGQRRVKGVCWCCASTAQVRPCAYWLNGQVRELCKDCEKTQAVLKPCQPNCPQCEKRKERAA